MEEYSLAWESERMEEREGTEGNMAKTGKDTKVGEMLLVVVVVVKRNGFES